MKTKKWKKCCEEQPTIDPETGECQNGCGPKTQHTPLSDRIISPMMRINSMTTTGKVTAGTLSAILKTRMNALFEAHGVR